MFAQGDDLHTAHIDWDQRAGELLSYFRTPAGVPFAAFFLREILEHYTILGRDANDALLVAVKTLGQRPPNQTAWPRPNDEYWAERIRSFGGFLYASNPEPYFEQQHIGPKQTFAYDLLGLHQLQNAYANLGINWTRCRNLVQGRAELTSRYIEATDMDLTRMPAPVRAATEPIMQEVIPHRSRRDQRRAEMAESARAANERAASQGSSIPAQTNAPGWNTVRRHVQDGGL
ncbi:hypothetical protein CALVIDRAFT_569321 [Calocera viscosa TUFC12733]|uniref:Uncharacterized protein n=1 Tax=Calocera viscosa (strain TUFC12733) TaxID=1330018 RepID=A0A167G4M3_CALVF|nr:hypothetical protein CALVIDRAFT_569321 [Calocera viscosa TUFC12733]